MTTHLKLPLIGKVKNSSAWVIGLMAAGVLAVGSTTYFIVNRASPQLDITELTVPVESKNVTLRITASGKVTPVRSVNISPKTSGQVVELRVEQGDSVKQGQIIARMDSADIQAQLLQAQANLAQAQAQLDQALRGSRLEEIEQAKAKVEAAKAQASLTSARVQRNQELARQGAIAQDSLDEVLSDDRSAKANLQEVERRLAQLRNGSRPEEIAQRRAAVAAAEGELQAIQVKLNDTIIRAPFSGIVTQKYAQKGAFVTPTTSASSTESATSASIVKILQGLEIIAQVPEVDVGQIKQGQTVEIVADSYPDKVFKGHVRLISPEAVVEQNVTSFQVRITIDTGKKELRSGMNTDVTFLGETLQDALLVPTVAIVTEQGKTGVLIPDQKNKPQFRPVIIGASVENQTQILSGINESDRVFIDLPKEQRPKDEE
jgi:HlyD family secretion protein